MPQTPINFPPGRMVYGSVNNAQPKKNNDGTPKLDKNGQPMLSFNFGVAFAKGAERHWAETPWGALIWATGHADWPNGEAQRTDFAWKVIDGDSQVPGKPHMGKPGRKPCDKEGFKGHWVVSFSSVQAPRAFTMVEPSGQILGRARELQPHEVAMVAPGHYIEVQGSTVGNKAQSPGLYMNPSGICLRGFGTPIVSGPEVDAGAFGQGAAPVGMSTTLPQGMAPQPPAAAPAASYIPPAPGAVAPVVPASVPAPNLVPNPAVLSVPGVPAAPVAAPPVPPAPPAARVMSAKAGGATYEQFVALGWTDAMMAAEGMFA